MKLLYTNAELNLPHHLSYVAALPCKCTQRILHVKLRVKIVCVCCLTVLSDFNISFGMSDSKYLRLSVE